MVEFKPNGKEISPIPLGEVKEYELGNWLVRASFWAFINTISSSRVLPTNTFCIVSMRNTNYFCYLGCQLEEIVVNEFDGFKSQLDNLR